MKRLFQVNKPNGHAVQHDDGSVSYYEDKPSAKRVRDALNKEHPNGGYTVSIGPDHKGLLTRKSRGHLRANRIHTSVQE